MENESRVMEGITAVLNETVSNVSKSFFSGLKDLKKKNKTKNTLLYKIMLFYVRKSMVISICSALGTTFGLSCPLQIFRFDC